MTPEEFRQAGYALIDWIADYLEGVDRFPVGSPVAPGDIAGRVRAHPPTGTESFADILEDLDDVIVPGLTHWQHPRFFAYFPANISYPSILGELASAGLGVQGMSWVTSPACTELETAVVDWMAELLGLPAAWRTGSGVIQGSASEATLCAIVAARWRASGGAVNLSGASAMVDLVAYASAQAHSSVEKGLRIAGIGTASLRIVPHDANYAMDPDALGALMAQDVEAGRRPVFVAATVGTTTSMAIDPVARIAPVAHAHGAWVHVDGAMAGMAALVEEYRGVNDGLDDVDSYCTNPHKWMGINFDCDLFWCADRGALLGALSILPEYLRSRAAESGAVRDYRDWQVPLGRRFRALKLWFALRLDGVAPVQAMMRRQVAMAAEVARWVRADERFELPAPVQLNLVCLALGAGNAATDALIEAANATGEVLFTRGVLDGRSVLRWSIGGWRTTEADLARAWSLLTSLAPSIDAPRNPVGTDET